MSSRIAVHRYQKKEFVLQPFGLKILLETDNYEEASKLEAFLIEECNSTNLDFGYNRRYGDSRYGFPDHVKIARSNKVKMEGTYAGSNNSNFGKRHSEETKNKIRNKVLSRDPSTFENNKHKTPEQIQKLHEGRDLYLKNNQHPMLGKTHSEEAREKISKSAKGHKRWLGKKHSEESKQRMRDAQKKCRLEKKKNVQT